MYKHGVCTMYFKDRTCMYMQSTMRDVLQPGGWGQCAMNMYDGGSTVDVLGNARVGWTSPGPRQQRDDGR